MSVAPRLATLSKLSPTGTPASLRVLLPPNLPAAATRDAIAVRFEIAVPGRGQFPAGMAPDDRALHVPSAQLSALFLIESWNNGRAVTMAQLSRAQLGALLAVLQGEPVFYFVNRGDQPLPWVGDKLAGVSEHLSAAKADAPASTRPSAAPAPPQQPPANPSRARASTDAAPPLVDGSEHYLAIQLPSREHYAYEQLLELLKREGFRLEPSNRKWWLRDRHKTLNFLAENWSRLRDEWGADFTSNFERHTAHLRFAEVDCEVQPAGEDFQVTLAVRAGTAPEREVHASLTTGRTYVESGSEVFLFDRARLDKLHAAQRALGGSTAAPLLGRSAHRVPRVRIAEVDAVLTEISPHLQTPAEWRRRAAVFRELSALPPAPTPEGIDRWLRPYQRLGVAWLWHLHAAGLGGILADEMGLGKTLQALALLAARRTTLADRTGAMPALVVCPASLLENWRREAARFAPELHARVHHGEARTANAAELRAADLVITSYGTLARDQQLLAGIAWDTLIADEAQHVKNRRTQNAQALQSLRAHGRILLTGTPVENSLADLESLFAVILPGYLKGIPADARGEDRAWHEARVRRQAAPYILRRTKAQVSPELPAKIEQTVFVEMTAPQRALYETVRARSESELLELELAGQSEGRIRVAMFTQLLRLRQVCGDPRLIDAARDPAESAKLAALLELLDEAIDDGHRVLIFSQFTSLLALVRAALEAQGTPCAYLDGTMPAKARQAEVDRFNAGGADLPVFLLSLKAGGTGLNLASADTVVHLDPWWNPAVEAQATDRAHRIGQTRVVTSYKLIAAGTVEERVLAMQHEKRALLANVFEQADAANAALTLADLKALVAG